MKRFISGVQQVGIGVANVREAFEWYKNHFGFSTIIFDDKAPASLMTRYTGGEIHERHAVLAMNMQGGAGIEIWQYMNRIPRASEQPIQFGDTGIHSVKLRCRNVKQAFQYCTTNNISILTAVAENPQGKDHFYLKDPYGNMFEIIEDDYWFQKNGCLFGGICGATIGVSNTSQSLEFYKNVLGYDIVEADVEGMFNDLEGLAGGKEKLKRVILRTQNDFSGAFSKLLGPSTIELVQAKEYQPKKIFNNRYWGDLGFIHICYDMCGIKEHADVCATTGYPLTVNSGDSFSMGNASGHFAYNEDPDGTLIEYVETHKVPVLKGLGWNVNLRKRNRRKPLPDWLIRCMGWSKKSLSS